MAATRIPFDAPLEPDVPEDDLPGSLPPPMGVPPELQPPGAPGPEGPMPGLPGVPALPGAPPPGPELPPDMLQPEEFSAPIPDVPISLPPPLPGIGAGSRVQSPSLSMGITRSYAQPSPDRRRAGPGSPIEGGGAELSEDERMRMILSQMGLA